MSYCPRHTTFNRFCRDCLRRKYAADEERSVEDATGFSRVVSEAALEATQAAIDTPDNPDF